MMSCGSSVRAASRAISMAKAMLDKGVYVTGFGYPVVPEGTARIRIQVSEALTYDDLDYSMKVVKEIHDSY